MGPYRSYYPDSYRCGLERHSRQHLANVIANGAAPQYSVRPDFDPSAALDPAATTVELANWRLEMDMHFAYTLAQNALALVLDSVGEANKASLKVEFHPTPLHF